MTFVIIRSAASIISSVFPESIEERRFNTVSNMELALYLRDTLPSHREYNKWFLLTFFVHFNNPPLLSGNKDLSLRVLHHTRKEHLPAFQGLVFESF